MKKCRKNAGKEWDTAGRDGAEKCGMESGRCR
jgi:hypothetical protein